ncbi:2-oxoglutarate dehydrogenase E1 component [Fimbriiglobus ruber]|uniref:oxoglutarate dehydrogenase (succinyl-transferring) n=1 Tax=Fimbriiglobus ruber TaxID=1908690 RepID=A0A225DF60_9BACT|nr:2-oxoglutarate dehydrogenase E1 component [Fimbriiglobus ruber]OWK35976.1 2-oxoglutarate dehydrogenase E1 component [Fimbriiglobus ruber]
MAAPSIADSYNRDLIEDAYEKWQRSPDSVEPSWQAFFAGVEFAGNGIAQKFASGEPSVTGDLRLQTGVTRLVMWYRQAGHLQAHIDPLQPDPPAPHPHLRLENFGLSDADLDKTVDGSMYFGINGPVRLGDLFDALRETYCRNIGVEYVHIDDLDKRKWLARKMEPTRNRPTPDLRQKLRILMTLHWAAYFENYLHTKFVGQKRFSLEGAETLLPMLDAIVEKGPSSGVQEIVIGMAHRGRLNVLVNTLHKPFAQIFNEFEDLYLPETTKDGDGDVKYHMGFSEDVRTTDGGSVHLSISPNPSHLEIINPVVEGRVRAKQRIHGDVERTRGVPLLIHGDAAFAGQGVVAETLNLANLTGYRTGGTLHIVINNQIGFTTPPRDSRSTQYCTDLAKFIQAPIFHVNGDDPEAAVYVAQLALEFRQQFKSDVVIDMVCYRKYGHNEGDEPSFTNPVMYRQIKAKSPVPVVYTQKLIADGAIKPEEADAIDAEFRRQLDDALKGVKSGPPKPKKMAGFTGSWGGLTKEYTHTPVDTHISAAVADRIADQLTVVPEGFHWHPTVKKLAEKRRDDIRERKPLDWGTGEVLAFGSLVLDGHLVRLSGQDSRRGTFSHRHSYYFDSEDGKGYCPLDRLDPGQAPFDVFDSSLSEAAVLGFEYGYSLDDPNALVMWEAQFGDFANGAQVVIDQFITSGESKWNRASGLVMLLPHGYEGQGPEHSSARLERFLQSCAEDNMQVCNFTTPAQLFHALRRQVKRTFRKPLIVVTPKSLLRHPLAVSPVSEFTEGRFNEVLDDTVPADGVRRVVLCSGKVYYDLLAKRTELKRNDVALVRLEQFYPWPEEQLKAVLGRYRRATEWVWAQEESHNMGGWFFVEPRLRAAGVNVQFVGRDPSASPAAGSHHVHKHEQEELVTAALSKPAPYFVAAAQKKA